MTNLGTNLRTIVYVSSAAPNLGVADLEFILADARRRNAENGITGVLLHHDESFMQCFEGPAAAVSSTYQRIRASRQHSGLVEILDEPIGRRRFEGFDMGSAQATASELLALSTARWTRQQQAAGAGDDSSAGMALLCSFWQGARHL